LSHLLFVVGTNCSAEQDDVVDYSRMNALRAKMGMMTQQPLKLVGQIVGFMHDEVSS
jgi:hypothetical protein